MGKGALAPCPPINAASVMLGTLRFAHRTDYGAVARRVRFAARRGLNAVSAADNSRPSCE